MTEKPTAYDPEVGAPRRQGRRSYAAPLLVRYGGLFTKTLACSEQGSDDTIKGDNCNPDGGPVDGT